MPISFTKLNTDFGKIDNSDFLKISGDHTKKLRDQRATLRTKIGVNVLSNDGPETMSKEKQKQAAQLSLRNKIAEIPTPKKQPPREQGRGGHSSNVVQKNSTVHPTKLNLLNQTKIQRWGVNDLSSDPLKSMING